MLVGLVAACGIDAVGQAILGPDRDEPDVRDAANADDRSAADVEELDAGEDADIDALELDCGVCPLGFTCSLDAGCTDFARPHFILTANPSVQWSWGTRSRDAAADVFAPMPVGVTDPANGIDQWSTADGSITPGVFVNPSSSVIHPYGTFTMQPRQMAFHPGPNDERAIVRWTAPAARTYVARVVVVGLSGYNGAQITTTNVTVTRNGDGGTSVLGKTNVGHDGGAGSDASVGPFTIDVPSSYFSAGDTLDVAVDYGQNANFGYDSTGVDVTVFAP